MGVSSPLQFQRLFRALLNSSSIVPGYAEAAVLVPFTFLEGAISLAGSVHPELVQAELLAYYQPSFYGLITTNRTWAVHTLLARSRACSRAVLIESRPTAY